MEAKLGCEVNVEGAECMVTRGEERDSGDGTNGVSRLDK